MSRLQSSRYPFHIDRDFIPVRERAYVLLQRRRSTSATWKVLPFSNVKFRFDDLTYDRMHFWVDVSCWIIFSSLVLWSNLLR